MKPEAQLSKDVRAFLQQVGCAVWSTEQGYRAERGGTRTTPGYPDLIVLHPDAWTFVELKAGRNDLNGAQIVFRDECLKARVPWQLWRSVDDAWQWAVNVGLVTEG